MIDQTKLTFASIYGIDKVLDVFSGTFIAPSQPITLSVLSSNNTTISDLVFFQGVYSIDGGINQDIGSEALANGFAVQALGASQNGQLNLYANNADTLTHSISYQIAMLAKPSNTLYVPQNVDNDLYFSTVNNYQKIDLQDTIPITIVPAPTMTPVDTLIKLPHNLGYRPCVRAFVDNGTVLTDALVRNGIALIYNIGVFMTNYVDNTDVYLTFTNFDNTTYKLNLSYRIYYDPN